MQHVCRLCSATKREAADILHESNKGCVLSINRISFPVSNPFPPICCRKRFCNVYAVWNKQTPDSFTFPAFPATFAIPQEICVEFSSLLPVLINPVINRCMANVFLQRKSNRNSKTYRRRLPAISKPFSYSLQGFVWWPSWQIFVWRLLRPEHRRNHILLQKGYDEFHVTLSFLERFNVSAVSV